MKKMLALTIIFIAVPSVFVFTFNKKEEIIIPVTKVLNTRNNKEVNIRVKQISKNKIITINLEDYVKGVIAGEMPLSFNIEALKSQAVAARTYALKRIKKDGDYDVVDTVMNQVYLDNKTLLNKWGNNYNKYMEKINIAVSSTKGEYVDYNGNYADTLFFSTSVGNTENSEEIFGTKVEYLKSVSSSWDEEVSPVYQERNTFTREEFCNKLKLNNCNIINVKILNETTTGRIKTITINNHNFTGTEVAYYLGIRSNYFDIYIENNKVVVKTKGFGHGVGMSQYGAEGMANNGYNYKDILNHYYQNTTIKNLYA